MSEETLDQRAILLGTDKGSIEHDYVRHYAREFEEFRHQPVQVLEIGIASGASLQMWQEYFTRATLIGVDIIPACAVHAEGRTLVEIGSQADPTFLDSLAAKYEPTIIIDDGSHQSDHIKLTFRHLFPSLRPGGCYVIEDLHFHIRPSNPVEPIGAMRFALDLTALVAKGLGGGDQLEDIPVDVLRTIDRVIFIRHAAIIWKKMPDENPQRTVAAMRELVERSGFAQNWFYFIYYSLERGGGLEQAEMAARNAIRLDGGLAGLANWRLSEVLERRGDLPASLAAAEEALILRPENDAIKTRIKRLKAAHQQEH